MLANKMKGRFIQHGRGESGQALVEYALILTLVVLALMVAVIATGPALGNVFSNAVCGLVDPLAAQPGGPPVNPCAPNALVVAPNAFWATVTEVALNPPNVRQFPVNPVPNTPIPPPTSTGTPFTPTPTHTATPTDTFTPTPTQVDLGYIAPWTNSVNTTGSPISEQLQWRVDNAAWVGLDDWRGVYYPQLNFGGTPQAEWNQRLTGNQAILNFNWGANPPLTGFVSDNFSVRWTRRIFNTMPNGTPMTVSVRAQSDDGIRICLNSTDTTNRACSASPTIILQDWVDRNPSSPILTGSFTLPANPANAGTPGNPAPFYWLTVEYYNGVGPANISVDLTVDTANLRDDITLPSGAPRSAVCKWTPITGSQPNSAAWSWSNAPGGNFNASTRCNLELRGYVDITNPGFNAPMLSFWDAWQLQAGDTVRLVVAEYQPYNADGTGGPDWAGGQTYTLATGGTSNFAWTYRVVPVLAQAGTSRRLALRFQFDSSSTAGQRRFFLDDLTVDNMPRQTFGVCTGDPILCPSYNTLDDTRWASRFITSGRWSLDGQRTANNSPLAWSSSATSGGTYVRFGDEQGTNMRLHTIEFNGDIDFTTSGIDPTTGQGGTVDFEGNEGFPVLTFWHAYNLDIGESLRVEWTRDARDATPDTWTTLSTILATTTAPVSQAMQEFTDPILLSGVPNWRTSPFRLRFVFSVNQNNTLATGGGWWLDNIVIKRQGAVRYANFPFCDSGEGSVNWRMNGNWGTFDQGRGTFVGGSYADSPLGNYTAGQQTAMELRFVMDLNADSPDNPLRPSTNPVGSNVRNISNCLNSTSGNPSGATGARAQNPLLVFYHWRSLAANHTIHVDISRSARTGATGTTAIPWTNIWSYTYNANTAIQLGWERVEIRLEPGIVAATGTTWAALTSNTSLNDDDWVFRIRLNTTSGAGTNNGLFIDDISLDNVPLNRENTFKWWPAATSITVPATDPPAGAGEGTSWAENFDDQWFLQMMAAASWDTARDGVDGFGRDDYYSGSLLGSASITDSPPASTNYTGNTFAVLEVRDIIDMRGTRTTDRPMMTFWHKYRTGTGAELRVQVAVEDRANLAQSYDKIPGYGPWTAVTWNAGGSVNNFINENLRNDGWTMEQINLASYADDPATTAVNEGRRIRIRFVVDSLGTTSNLTDGWFIDDIRLSYRNPVSFNLPFADSARNISSIWRAEGIGTTTTNADWGLAGDLWRGEGTGLGASPWQAYWFDCIDWMRTPAVTTPVAGDLDPVSCDVTSGDNTLRPGTFFDNIPRTSLDSTATWLNARTAWRDNALYSINPTNAPSFTLRNDINYDFGSTRFPSGGASPSVGTNPWLDNYMARFVRRITVPVGPITFSTLSDDAVRLRMSTLTGTDIGTAGLGAGWNIIENWVNQGRNGSFRSATRDVATAGDYLLFLEYAENTGDALIQLAVGTNNFSFSDSPRANNNSPVVNSRLNSNISMVLNAVVNLPANATTARLGYYIYFDLAAGQQFAVEVSNDGGFTWSQNGLQGGSCPSGAECSPNQWGAATRLPNDGDWQFRSHSLSNFVSATAATQITFRFRLLTGANTDDGVWIADIRVDT
jgi:Flp pilus assembly pilin Flp